ncbi:hypothetical protein [Kocuria marina]|uniref:hypothetical protein n=1 Tax=Kocuria marina TaxID=223184 RepID=UPI00345F1B02
MRAPPTPGSWPCCKDCTLPLRTTIDRLRRDLLLGEPGRLYSELAASCSRRISRSPSSQTPLGPGIRALIIRADGAPRTGLTA